MSTKWSQKKAGKSGHCYRYLHAGCEAGIMRGLQHLDAILVPKWTENGRQKWSGNRGAAIGICMPVARLVS